jgi:hypothetical protein
MSLSFRTGVAGPCNGTIGGVSDHRIRLTDEELAIITVALRARLAMRHGARAEAEYVLCVRLEECARGNPRLKLGKPTCVHGVAMADRCAQCRARTVRHVTPASQEARPTSQRGVREEGLARLAGDVLRSAYARYDKLPNTETR